MQLREQLHSFPFIAITRGLSPDDAVDYARVLAEEGFTIIENPLNSPEPFASIRLLADHLGGEVLVGAGTVTEAGQVQQVKEAGGKVIISPNCDLEVIRATKDAGLLSIPGVATPSEAMAALKAGADGLKLFPAEMLPPAVVKAMRAILPADTLLLPVGSITADNWQPYFQAGANGFGLGSSLYSRGISKEDLRANARAFFQSWSGN